MKRAAMVAALGLALTTTAFAATGTKESDVKNSLLEDAFLEQSLADLTDEERALARKWKLTDSDWQKYKKIMSGPRGTWSPNLDPITALGVQETDPVERARYATIWMELEVQRAELELAFEAERMRAADKVLRGQKPINNEQWIRDWERKQQNIDTEVMLFIDPNCVDDCKRLMTEIQKTSTKGNTRLNIVFQNGSSADQIGSWANAMGIDPEIVRARKVTLNFDEGQFAQYRVASSELPEVYVKNVATGEIRETFKRY